MAKARKLTKEIYKATNLGQFARDFGLKDQIRRSAVSIMSNIAEGFERGRASEFHQFLSIAKGSCAELRSQLYVAFDAEYLTSERALDSSWLRQLKPVRSLAVCVFQSNEGRTCCKTTTHHS